MPSALSISGIGWSGASGIGSGWNSGTMPKSGSSTESTLVPPITRGLKMWISAPSSATGSAAGPLVAYLQDCFDVDSIVVEQGVEMGRPSRIEARMEGGHPRVSGAVAVVATGTVDLPGKTD